MNKPKAILAALALTMTVGRAAMATPYQLDIPHTDIGFSVRHLMVSTVKGSFKEFKADFDFDESKETVKNIDVDVQVASVDTRNADRDKDLRSSNFFDTANYPQMTFKAPSAINLKLGEPVKVEGMLTLRGVTKPVTLDLTYAGSQKAPNGIRHTGFSLTGKINRKDFGVSWNKILDGGGLTVSEEVNIDISGEIIPVQAKK